MSYVMGGDVMYVQHVFKTGGTVNMRTSCEEQYIPVFLSGSSGMAKGTLWLAICNRKLLVSRRLVRSYTEKYPV